MFYPKGRCPEHPHCKAWVLVAGRAICFECWNDDTRSTVEKEEELREGGDAHEERAKAHRATMAT